MPIGLDLPPALATERVRLFGIDLSPVTMERAVQDLMGWIAHPDGRCHYVVTPNVDHALLFQERPEMREAYSRASLVLADGHPVVWVSRLLGRPVPERVPGSDVTPALFDAGRADLPLDVFLLGAGPGVAERAAVSVRARYPHVRVVGTYSPPLGFERDPDENERILKLLEESRPNVLVVGLGAPKQELFVYRNLERLGFIPVALCVGATIDFLAGARPRAPGWMQDVGLEWIHRAFSEPKRLLPRYARNIWQFPQLVWRELGGQGGGAGLRAVVEIGRVSGEAVLKRVRGEAGRSRD
jgi:N-acetylglucosaminyldiphosphoundecaprenol N-acetyl-beta-D-mannosaminyltransferase